MQFDTGLVIEPCLIKGTRWSKEDKSDAKPAEMHGWRLMAGGNEVTRSTLLSHIERMKKVLSDHIELMVYRRTYNLTPIRKVQ
jgi:hypothetical protein